MQLEIKAASDKDLDALEMFVWEHRISKMRDYFITQYESQLADDRLIVQAIHEEKLCGYCILNWNPKYGLFRVMKYPEVQDLNVRKDMRGQGIATAIIEHCEGLARARNITHMGISVGLSSSYGPAQRLYIKLGYVPDGHGVTYDRKGVSHGEIRPVDDDLCLMMLKDL